MTQSDASSVDPDHDVPQTRAMPNELTDEQRGHGQEKLRRLVDMIASGLASGEGRRVTEQLIDSLRARSFTDD